MRRKGKGGSEKEEDVNENKEIGKRTTKRQGMYHRKG